MVAFLDSARWGRGGRPEGAFARRLGLAVFLLLAVGSPPAAPLAPAAPGAPATPAAQDRVAYRDPAVPVEARVADLLARMTLEEKFWQLFMIPGSLDDPAHDYSNGVFGLQIGTAEGLANSGGAEETANTAGAGETANSAGAGETANAAGAQETANAAGAGALQAEAAGAIARAHTERINAIQRFFVEDTRLGIPIIPFDEAVHGLTRAGATVFPQAIALAASWDIDLMARVAAAIARETRSRGIRQVLSPVVNIADDVRWGRVEETYGEDPHLAAEMGRAFVRAFEGAGIVTTPKHFVANVGEGGRDSYPIGHSERTLIERFFPPFEVALRAAGARSLMTAYNSVDGSPATQSPRLLNGILKGEWGFTGFVISDAAATGGATVLHMTEPDTPTAAKNAWEAGLDVVFQSRYGQQRPYLEAVQRGLVSEAVIDAAVARVLRAKFEIGLFEEPYADAAEAATWNGHPDHLALAREAAAASIVLLKNAGDTLPLSESLRSVAVIGADAAEARLGGYSGPGTGKVSILDGIRARLGAAAVLGHAPGPGRIERDVAVVPSEYLHTTTAAATTTANPGGGAIQGAAASSGGVADPGAIQGGAATPGVTGHYFDNIDLAGEPLIVRTDPRIDFRWTLNSPGRGIPFDWYSVRWTGALTAPPEGARRIGVEGNDGYRLWLDGRLLIDNWRKVSYGRRLAAVDLAPGSIHDLRLEYFESTGGARVRLVWDAGVESGGDARINREAGVESGGDARIDREAGVDSGGDAGIDEAAGAESGSDARIEEAATLARDSDVAIVVAGLEEGEFRDRAFLGLPGRQEELIQRVAATGTPVVVVLIGGSAITMSGWLDQVAAVVDAWYPGEQGGDGIADVLFGDVTPAGRLPITFPMAEGQLPLHYNHKPTGRGDDYTDLTGMPLFPFGYGLSYTSFAYANLRIEPAAIAAGGSAEVRATVTNTGPRRGDEVVQLYVRDILASVARPVQELKGFARVRLAPGESTEVVFRLGPEHLRMLDAGMQWIIEPGRFRVMVGSSSEDIRLRGELVVR